MGIEGKFYSESPTWYEKIGRIYALLERVIISEEQCEDNLRLRKLNRIMSIHSSTAIEGNKLTLNQVTDVVNGKPVWGPPKDIKEVQNAWQAYNELDRYDPWNVEDLLKAHSLMTDTLVGESGVFRSVDVAVVRYDGEVLHRGAPPTDVPFLVDALFKWGKNSDVHPLIKSSAVHFMLEFIHPFRDGNGRIGRLWQTLILSEWDPIFAWMPVETLIHDNQQSYYKALQDSHVGNMDCNPFIDFMFDVIENSLLKYIDITSEATTVGVNVGVNVGVKKDLLILLKQDPSLTLREIALKLNKSKRTIERYVKELREEGALRRIGSDKDGVWQVNDSDDV
jgi:Uncharacterized conserved protein